MPRFPNEIEYGEKYYDDFYEYRHVILPKQIFKSMPRDQKVLSENQWRMLGIQQSRGWIHYDSHKPEPYILLFRRPKGTDPSTGLPPRGFKDPDIIEQQQQAQIQMQHQAEQEMKQQLIQSEAQQQQQQQQQNQQYHINPFLRKNKHKYSRYDYFNNTQ